MITILLCLCHHHMCHPKNTFIIKRHPSQSSLQQNLTSSCLKFSFITSMTLTLIRSGKILKKISLTISTMDSMKRLLGFMLRRSENYTRIQTILKTNSQTSTLSGWSRTTASLVDHLSGGTHPSPPLWHISTRTSRPSDHECGPTFRT